jgi:anthraniloyl-CoA monooxygenase
MGTTPMKVNIVGGGPAGLYFAILMKKLDPENEVILFERDGPNDTYGWGIVFSDRTMTYLRDADQESHDAITAAFETWPNVDVIHQDQKISVHGNKFSGIARVTFLNILQKRCGELGVDMNFLTNITDVDRVKDCDLLVAADGANSWVRKTFEDAFEPTLDVRKNKYIWLGTERLFHGLSMILRTNEAGVYVAHAYKFSKTHSTFIVECVGDTWEKAGVGRLANEEVCEYLADVFKKALDGKPLLHNNFVRWLNFVIVKNQSWVHDNVVLLGDAAHTAHFSIGSGTKLALEDAIALAGCFHEKPDVLQVRDALADYQKVRKPVVEDLQQAAESSLTWLENAKEKIDLNPIPLTYELMTRSRKVDYEKLKKRDPSFIAVYDRWRGRSPAA